MSTDKSPIDRPTVYVAGPYSSDPVMGTREAIHAADAIWEAGGAPYIPHLTHLWHLLSPHPYETWLELDLIWVSRCDMLVRLPGKSSGADREVFHAQARGIPVYVTLAGCLDFLRFHADKALDNHRKSCDKLCIRCHEGWPVHRVNDANPYIVGSLITWGWVHTQPEELKSDDSPPGTPQTWEPCLASLLRDQHRKQG